MNHSSKSSRMPSSTSMHDENSFLESINYSVFTYVDPAAVTLGALGNVVICLIFTCTPQKVRPWSHVQSGMGVVDLMYVISCFVVHLSKRGQPVYDAPSLCQVTTFTLMVSRSLQAWFVFISHFDRLNSHFTNGGESRRRRVYNTKFALVIVTLLVVAPSVHVMWAYEVRTIYGRPFCVPMRDDMQFHIIMRKIHIIGSVIVPIALTLGIDLFFVLKLALHFFCSVSDDDDDEDGDPENLGVYTGYKIGDNSSFCSENIVQLPMQEKKSDLCEHLLSNTTTIIETCRQKQQKNLSTIVEGSVTSSSRNKSSNQDKLKTQEEKRNIARINDDDVLREDRTRDKNSILQRKCDRKQEVARYILTTATHDDCVEKDVSDLALSLETNLLPENKQFDKMSSSRSTLSPDISVKRQNHHKGKENNNKRSPRSSRKPSKKTNSGVSRNAKGGSQVSIFNSSINHSCTHNSVSYSHYHSYNYTSMVSNVSKSTVIPEDNMLSSDMTSSSVTTVIIGIVMCSLVIPSAYVEGKILFLSSVPPSRPSALSIQKAIFFESLVLFNSVYKLILYVIVMKSFRQAFIWFVISCVPRRFTTSASICTLESDEDNKSDSANIDEV